MTTNRLGWLTFTRRFSMLIDLGVPIVPALHVLAQELPAPFDTRAQVMQEAITAGATLTHTLQAYTDDAPPYLLPLVRAGEVGGVLQITLARAVELLEEELRMGTAAGVPLDADWAALVDDWNAATAPVRLLLLARYCRVVGIMLANGVPIVQTLDVAAALLPAVQQTGSARTVAAIRGHWEVAEIDATLDYLPPIATYLFKFGEDHGILDTVLLNAGACYRDELLLYVQ
jgi:type II secretory pathway component PulF